MKCSETKRLMSSYLDAAVTRGEMTAVQQHIDACGACSADYLALQRTQRLVRRVGTQARTPRPSVENPGVRFPGASHSATSAVGGTARQVGERI